MRVAKLARTRDKPVSVICRVLKFSPNTASEVYNKERTVFGATHVGQRLTSHAQYG